MGVKVIRIYELDGVVNARLELVGSFFEVEVPAGPVAGGYINKRLSFEQFTALLGSNTIGGAPQWVQGASYKEGQLVYSKLRLFRVQEDIASAQAEPLATNRYYRELTYDDTSIYALARAIRDRVDALDRNVIRWNQPRRITIPSGGGNPGYESGDAFVVYASSTSSSSNIFKFNAPDYPRQGDLVAVQVRADSVVLDIRGLRFGSPTGPSTFAGQPGQQYVFHAATDTPGDVTATYWVVHSTPSSGPTTAPTAVPFGPLTASGAPGETFPLPAGTQSVRGVQVFDVSPSPGQYPVVGLVASMYTLDATVSPPTLTIKAPYTLSQGDTIEGIAFTTGGTTTPTPGTGSIVVGQTQGSDSITVISTSAA